MNNKAIMNNTDKHAINTCLQVIKELILGSDKYSVSPVKFNALVKAYYALESLPEKKLCGFIDISVNTFVQGGAVDYSSFTISGDYLEIYTGFIQYKDGECDDTSWLKVYSSKDSIHINNMPKALECWAESFLLHLENNPSRTLCIIDRSQVQGDESVKTEINPAPKVVTPGYSYEPLNAEFEEVPF
jgi:hypothetical protein